MSKIAEIDALLKDLGIAEQDAPKKDDPEKKKDDPETKKKEEPKKKPEIEDEANDMATSPGPAAPAKEPPKKDEPEDDDEDDVEESLCIPAKALNMAKEELRSYSDFLEQYRSGDDAAFDSEMNEGDDPETLEKKERPPKAWFGKAVKKFEKDPKVDDPEALAANIWYHWAGPKAKKQMKAMG